MTKAEKLLADYGFESFKEFLDIIEHSEREGENSLFFGNAMGLIEELYNLAIFQEGQLYQKENNFNS